MPLIREQKVGQGMTYTGSDFTFYVLLKEINKRPDMVLLDIYGLPKKKQIVVTGEEGLVEIIKECKVGLMEKQKNTNKVVNMLYEAPQDVKLIYK